MFKWMTIKTITLIIISFSIIFINHSYCDDKQKEVELKQECDTWNKFCISAKSGSNKNFRCYSGKGSGVIYFYEPEQRGWDEARQLCSLKFEGSYFADLVQLPDNRKEDVEKMLGDLDIKKEIELATSGVCCMKKQSDNKWANECGWLSSLDNEKHSELFDGHNSDKCSILTIIYDGKQVTGSRVKEKSSDPSLPYLCGYNLPEKCILDPSLEPSTTTTSTTTTTTSTTNSPRTSDKPDSHTTENTKHTTKIHSNSTDIDHDLEDIENQIGQGSSNSELLLNLSEELKDVLKNKTIEHENSLKKTLDIVYKMQGLSKILDKHQIENFTENIVESLGRAIDAEHVWDRMKNTETRVEMASNILEHIQDIGFNLGCRNDTTNTDQDIIIKPNIVVKTFTLDFQQEIEFKVSGIDSSITVPAGIPQPPLDDDCKSGTGVGSMFDKLSRYLTTHLDDKHEINSNIVAFSVQNKRNTTPLPPDIPPLRIVVKHNTPLIFGDRVNCVYWDFQQMNWSSNGCQFQQINSNRKVSICECNHLTNFAALMDVSGRETDTKVKDILTKVCCGLSIICLIVTIAFLTLVRVLRNRRNAITCNLCVCLLIVNLLVVFGMDSTQNNGLCQTVAAFLLYFILCTFSWMLMEGYHLYQMIVLVFSNIGYLRSIYMYAIGYGAPLLIALSAMLGIGFKNLRETDSYFCWISSPSHPYRVWAVAGPATVAILANGLIMYLALKEAFSAKVKKSLTEKDFSSDSTNIKEKLSQSFSWVKGFISLVFLLGITWISFVLYIHEFGNFFSYIFIILNGLQGVFIFIFQILLNDKARAAFRKTYHKRLPSRYLSSLYRTTSTNVFTSMRSKSVSRDKSSIDNSGNSSSNSSNCGTNKNRIYKSNDVKQTTIASHRSQSISMDRIRNASDSILF